MIKMRKSRERLSYSAFLTAALALTLGESTLAFVQPVFCHPPRLLDRGLASSVGDGQPPSGGDSGKKSNWDDFLDPGAGEESENLRKAREFMSENSLPISFNHDEPMSATDKDVEKEAPANATSSALVERKDILNDFTGSLSPERLARNPYMAVVSKLSPSELISKFTSTAHPSVQNAVRSTILGLIGGLPKMAFDTTTITTGQKLASLMFQLQMTGYMFKNAEYRMSVQQSLGSGSDQLLLSGSDDEQKIDPLEGKVKGKLRIKYTGSSKAKKNDAEKGEGGSSGALEVEVDAAAYMSELRTEVARLRDELMVTRKEKEEAMRKDLLQYIRTLPPQELQSLTNTMSQDVLVAMKGLVNAVIAGIGEGQIGPDTVTEQSSEAMAQLCMWQLAIGYNLRTLEVREEMRKSLTGSLDIDESNLSEPGTLE